MKKILLICNESNTVVNFRKELIQFLQEREYQISVIAGDSLREKEIRDLGVDFYCVKFKNRSKNPFGMLKTKQAFQKIVKLIKPDIVFTFQLKPNILGLPAARKAGVVKRFAMVEGIGDSFQPKNFYGRIIRTAVSIFYKHSLKYAQKVFFLNRDDVEEFVSRKIIAADKCLIIPGIGIDTSEYKPDYNLPKEKKVLLLSRLVKTKGIFDYCDIAREVHKTRPDIIFELYGSEQELKVQDIQPYIDDGSIVYGGYSTNAKDLIKGARIISSPSYREGFPRNILEGMALGKTIIATNAVGNRDAVDDGVNGFLVPIRDIKAYAEKVIEVIDDDERLLQIGKSARKKCVEEYDSKIVNLFITNIIDQ